MNLTDLPQDHKLRTSPLAEISAVYRQIGTKTWFEVLPSFGIAKKCFNDLGVTWTNGHEWSVK